MFCKNCGKEIDNNAYVCVHCGVLVNEQVIDEPKKERKNSGLWNGFAQGGYIAGIVLFALSFIPLLGFVAGGFGFHSLAASIIGLKSEELKGKAKKGIIFSSLAIGLPFILYFIYYGIAYVVSAIFSIIVYILVFISELIFY